jgi:fatty acid/phospholipid biosynthesis enzyme
MKSSSAEETLKTATTYLAVGNIEPDQSESRYVFTDGYNGTVFLAWKNDMMVIISGLAKDQADIAEKYTSEILK